MRLHNLGNVTKQNPLFSAYTSEFPRVKSFFTYPGDELESFSTHGKWLAENYRQDRSRLVEILSTYNRELGCGKETLDNLERLKDGSTLAVVTGQQAGVLSGPLFTIYKAITAIQLAREMETQLKVPVVPVFWVAGEDHDFQEVNHIYSLQGIGRTDPVEEIWGARQPEVRKLVLPEKVQGKPPVSCIPVEDGVFSLIEEVDKLVQDTPCADLVTDMLRETADRAENLSQWFGALLTRLQGRFGLILCDPMLPGIRELMRPFFHQAVGLQDELYRALESTGQELETRGFSPAFRVDKTFTGLFCVIRNQRVALTYQDSKYYAHGLTESWTPSELEEAMARMPQMFSTSAVLRPVVQDKLFPTLAYVGGPGEIAYFAQLKQVYQLFGQRMPVAFPRKSYLLIEPGVADILKRFALKIEDLATGNVGELLRNLTNRLEGLEFRGRFEKLRELLAQQHASLVAELAASVDDMELLAPGNLDRILSQIDYLEKKTNQKLRKKYRNAVNEFYFALNSLFPKGRPQERLFNVMTFLAGYGEEWLDWLVAAGQGKGFSYSYLNQALYLNKRRS